MRCSLPTPLTFSIIAKAVPEDRRLSILPHYLKQHLMIGEASIYNWMRRLCEGYNGGYWEFVELAHEDRRLGFFMFPSESEPWHLRAENGFDQPVSQETAGLIVCLYAFNHLWWRNPSAGHLQQLYEALFEYACRRSDASVIRSAID
ncbi:antirestriction protein [Achromobacter aloeverae]